MTFKYHSRSAIIVSLSHFASRGLPAIAELLAFPITSTIDRCPTSDSTYQPVLWGWLDRPLVWYWPNPTSQQPVWPVSVYHGVRASTGHDLWPVPGECRPAYLGNRQRQHATHLRILPELEVRTGRRGRAEETIALETEYHLRCSPVKLHW